MIDVLNWFADRDRFLALLLLIAVTGWAFGCRKGED